MLRHPLEWSPVDKAGLVVSITVPFVLGYVVRIRFLLAHPEVEPYIRRDVVGGLGNGLMAYLAVAVVLLATWPRVRRASPRSPIFVYTAALLWFGTIATAAYLVGPFSTPVLAGFLASAMSALVLFENRVAFVGMALAAAIFFGTLLAERASLIPYGPVFAPIPMENGRPNDDWILYNALFITAMMIVSISVLAMVMSLWRHRDAEVRWMACVDGLTHLANRRHFLGQVALELERAKRFETPVGLLMIDVDHFKRINDARGHLAGDRVLAEVASTLVTKGLRAMDVAGRYGGEEFAVLLPGTDLEGTRIVAERCRRLVADMALEVEGVRLQVTASVGFVAYPHPAIVRVEDLVRLADDALYQAKAAGRNRVAEAA